MKDITENRIFRTADLFKPLISVCLLGIFTSLSACGGGSTAGDGNPTPTIDTGLSAGAAQANQLTDNSTSNIVVDSIPGESEILTGVFIDSPVINLSYIVGGNEGKTNQLGEFSYREGESIRFSIGATKFPEVLAKEVITPLDFFETNSVQHTGVTNVIRLLQTLDSDGDSSNSIQISPDVDDKLKDIEIEIDLVNAQSFESSVVMAFERAGIDIAEVIPPDVALTHFSNSLLDNNLIQVQSLGADAGVSTNAETGRKSLIDIDEDGVADVFDKDNDNDGVPDTEDLFPTDASEAYDHDLDGIGDNIDADYESTTQDTDGDGIVDSFDFDDDNDGVPDISDPFPFDPTESKDLDGDGIGDTADEDDDNDGVNDVDDLVPDNADCSGQHDTTAGICNTELLKNISHIEISDSGIAYLSNLAVNAIFRFDLVANTWLTPVVLDAHSDAGTNLNVIEYHSTRQRLYMGFSTGEVSYLIQDSDQPTQIYTHTEAVGYLTTLGDSLLVSGTDRHSKPVTINSDGKVLESTYVQIIAPTPGEFAYSDTQEVLYYIDDRNDLVTLSVLYTNDRLHGGQTLGFGHEFKKPLLISPDETTLLTGNGHHYSVSSIHPLAKLDLEFSQAYWSEQDGLIAVVDINGQNHIQRLDERFNIIEQVSIDYQPLHIYHNSGIYYLLAHDAAGNHIVATYEPSQDSDNDFVLNSQDAFPTDPAAALDTDLDGAPDQWNSGYNEADSNSGLTLDHFPFDATCSLETEASDGSCDHENLMLTTKPDAIVTNNNGVVFLLYSAQNLIYRWDIKSKKYVDSLHVGTSTVTPSTMSYSYSNDRLYLGYSNGAVTYISLNDTSRIETSFVQTAAPVESVSYAGDYIRVGSQLGHSSIVKYYSHNAKVISEPEYAEPSQYSVWDNTNNKLFIFQADYLDVLHSEHLNSRRELITGWAGNSVRDDTPPIALSPDGLIVIAGSGRYFAADSLDYLGELDKSFTTGTFWNGQFVAGRGSQSNGELTYYDENYLRSSSESISGMPLAVISYSSELVLITHTTAGGVSISTITAP